MSYVLVFLIDFLVAVDTDVHGQELPDFSQGQRSMMVRESVHSWVRRLELEWGILLVSRSVRS